MVDPGHSSLSITAQCRLLAISRSGWYAERQGESADTQQLLRIMDAQFLETPYDGSRQLTRWLHRQGYQIGRHRVRRLMRVLGIEAIYQKPRTSHPHPHHKVYPYLLKGLTIDRPNQVWCADITYGAPSLRRCHGGPHRSASMDGMSRRDLKKDDSDTRSSLRKSASRSGGNLLCTGREPEPVGNGT